MEQDDDAWSYSFPPSMEDLTSPEANSSQIGSEESGSNDASSKVSEQVIEELMGTNTVSGDSLGNSTIKIAPSSLFDGSMGSDLTIPKTPKTPKGRRRTVDLEQDLEQRIIQVPKYNESSSLRSELSVAGDASQTNGGPIAGETSSRVSTGQSSNGADSSLHLQPAFMLKPALPADPQTTMEDVNSIMSKEGVANTSKSNDDGSAGLPQTSPVAGSEFRNSLRMWQQKSSEAEPADVRVEPSASSVDSGFVRRTLTSMTSPIFAYGSKPEDPDRLNGTEASPKVITYRKNTHERKESDSYSELLDKEERFDPKLYVSEKYKDTSYRYATIRRNVDFHQIFRSHDLTDRLLDDFACALSREILLQGRIYVTEQSVCFNSNLLGWVTSLVIQFEEIIRIEKKSTAGLFPNGILIETKDAKHNFASFLSRDATFDFIRTVWLKAVGKDLSDLDLVSSEESQGTDVNEDLQTTSQRRISNYIMSIDEDAQGGEAWSENSLDITENDDDYSSENEENIVAIAEKTEVLPLETLVNTTTDHLECVDLKETSKYQNKGPLVNQPTNIGRAFEDSENEIEVANAIIPAPLGIVFDVMFGSANTDFHKKVLESQGATEVSDYGAFLPNDEDEALMERKYTYRRPLGYSIGPKSTKCCVSEIIEHLDYSDHAVVLSITSTPDVPSGGSFTVRTRYYFLWADGNQTQIKIAFYVKWSGTSWIKGMVEKLTLSAQHTVNKEILEMLKQEVEDHTYKKTGASKVAVTLEKQTITQVPKRVHAKSRDEKRRPKHEIPEANTGWTKDYVPMSFLAFFVAFIFILVLMQWRLVKLSSETKNLIEQQMQLTSSLVQLIMKNSPEGRTAVSSGNEAQEQAALLVKQALQLLDKTQS